MLQAALTGESLPVEKEAADATAKPVGLSSLDRSDLVFFGTSVVSGTGTAVVSTTGRATAFGDVAARLAAKAPATEFDRGTRQQNRKDSHSAIPPIGSRLAHYRYLREVKLVAWSRL